MKSIVTSTLVAVGLAAALGVGAANASSSDGPALKEKSWSWTGIFGHYKDKQLQRGFQVYDQVCAACHGMKHLYYRNLTEIGYSVDEVKEFASSREVQDGPDENGALFMRPATLTDRFVEPFENEQIAALANGGVAPPDLSLMTKAREHGPDYIYNLLLGYPSDYPGEAPEWWVHQQEAAGLEPSFPADKYFNTYFGGFAISMPKQLMDGLITYADGTEPSAEQMAKDVVAFLNWAAEPELEKRKRLGLVVLLYLGVLTAFLYGLKKYVWRNVHH